MITAIVFLAVVAFVAILAAVSFARLARKNADRAESHRRATDIERDNWRRACDDASRAERALAAERATVARLRAMVLRRLDDFSAKDLSNAMCRRIIRDIFAKKEPSPASPATIDELMPNVLPEASE